MKQLQDDVVNKVQQFISSYFDDSLTENQIDELNQELEVKILASFYEHGIPSTYKTHKK